MQWCEKRFEQLQQYRRLTASRQAAELIVSAVDCLGLRASIERDPNFRLVVGGQQDLQDLAMCDMNEDLNQISKVLGELTEDQLGLLEKLPSVVPDPDNSLIQFLLQPKLDDADKLENFCRVARSFARKALEHDSIVYLRQVWQDMEKVLELVRAGKCDNIRDFVVACSKFKNSKGLGEALAFCHSSLPWLKDVIERAAGDVGHNARMILEYLLKSGRVLLRSPDDGSVGVDEVITVTYRNRANAETKMTLHDLRDLQSKLTLLTKSDESGDMRDFTQMVDAIEVLANEMLRLTLAGHCVRHEKSYMFKRDEIADVVTDYGTMERTLKEWNDQIRLQREKSPYLNLFTMQQINTLIDAARRMSRGEALDHAAQQLLRCSESDLDGFRQFVVSFNWEITNPIENIENLGNALVACGLDAAIKISDRAQYLFRGKPCAFEVKTAETQRFILDIHQQAGSRPSFKNTLLCNRYTTEEEVQNFVRRCALNHGLLIIAYVHRLENPIQVSGCVCVSCVVCCCCCCCCWLLLCGVVVVVGCGCLLLFVVCCLLFVVCLLVSFCVCVCV